MATANRTAEYGDQHGGSAFDIDTTNKPPKELLNITIWSNDGPNGKINGIYFKYRDQKEDVVEKPAPHEAMIGTQTGKKHPIAIGQGEYLNVISGFYNSTDPPVLNSLKFSTTEATYKLQYGKYPNTGDNSFNIDVGNDSIVALFGHYDSNQIRGIGAYRGPQA